MDPVETDENWCHECWRAPLLYREVPHNNLVIVIDDITRTPGPDGEDFFNVQLEVRNPAGQPGTLRRGPFIALRDETERTYESVGGKEVAVPIGPGDTVNGNLNFSLDEQARDIQMVIAPGTGDEVVIDLPDIPAGSR